MMNLGDALQIVRDVAIKADTSKLSNADLKVINRALARVEAKIKSIRRRSYVRKYNDVMMPNAGVEGRKPASERIA